MTREIGDKLETKLSELLGINKTTNSGAKYDNADLANRDIIIEAKVKNTKTSFSVPKTELTKVIKQARKHEKEWIYVQQNALGTFVLLDLDTYVEMSEEWWKKKKDKRQNTGP